MKIKEWYESQHDKQGAEAIPPEMTWDDLFLVLVSGKGQEPAWSKRTQERCIRELARVCRVNEETLRSTIRR